MSVQVRSSLYYGDTMSITWTRDPSATANDIYVVTIQYPGKKEVVSIPMTSGNLHHYLVPKEDCIYLKNAKYTQYTVAVDAKYFNGRTANIGEAKGILLLPTDAVPSFDFSYQDIGQDVFKNWTTDSVLEVTLTNIQGAYGSEIALIQLEAGGYVSSLNGNRKTATLTNNRKLRVGDVPKITVTDTRGAKTTKYINKTVYEYFHPSVTLRLTFSGGTVTGYVTTKYAEVGDENSLEVCVYRLNPNAANTELPYSNGVFTDTPEDAGYAVHRYLIMVRDKTGRNYMVTANDLKTARPHLSEEQYIAGMSEDGYIVSSPTIEIDNEKLVVDASGIASEDAYVGFPFAVSSGESYQIIYNADKEANVKAVFFNRYMDKITADQIVGRGIVSVPGSASWMVLLLGRDSSQPEIVTFRDISVKKLDAIKPTPIDWFCETIDLGLDDPNQKYVSKIQLRLSFTGILQISIAYDNGAYKQVFMKENQELKSHTVPINVRRCDHFKIRMEGKGQVKLYSFGYSLGEGSQRC